MTSSFTPECAALLAPIIQQFQDHVNAFFATLAAPPDAATFAAWEATAQQIGQAAAATLLQAALDHTRRQHDANPTPPRCACGAPLHYKGTFPRTLQTLVGLVTVRRGYYYCRACRQGRYVLDQALGLSSGQFSAAVQRGVWRLGAELPFERAAVTWTALTGIAISPRAVARLTEARGATLEAHRRAQAAVALQGAPLPAPRSGPGRPRGEGIWAVALDAARVCFVDDWHEVKAGVVCWAARAAGAADGRRTAVRATAQSYLVYTGSMERAGERLYAEALRRGIDVATEQVVCLGDGAPSIWQQFATHFPQRVEVLDWYHAVEHLWAAGNGVFGEGTAGAAAGVAAREAELWTGQVGAVQAALRQAAAQPGGAGGAAAAQEHYFATNAGRMEYARYRAAGYPIGSGVVESACKRVVGARAKGAGMRWSAPGVQAVLTLRAELLSGRWEESWGETEVLPQAA